MSWSCLTIFKDFWIVCEWICNWKTKEIENVVTYKVEVMLWYIYIYSDWVIVGRTISLGSLLFWFFSVTKNIIYLTWFMDNWNGNSTTNIDSMLIENIV